LLIGQKISSDGDRVPYQKRAERTTASFESGGKRGAHLRYSPKKTPALEDIRPLEQRGYRRTKAGGGRVLQEGNPPQEKKELRRRLYVFKNNEDISK